MIMMAVAHKYYWRFCVLLILSSVFQLVADAFVLPTYLGSIKLDGTNARGGQNRRSTLLPLQATNNTATSTKIEDDSIASILSQADQSVDAPLPPAYTDCPFSGVIGGPKSFYRTASKALQSPRIFSFVHKQKPMVEVSGGANVRKLLNQEFTNLSSNAVAGVSQIVCGTHSLRTARDKVEHRALRDLVGVPLAAKAVAASIPKFEAICRSRIEEMVLDQTKTNNDELPDSNKHVVTAVDVTEAMALDVTWQQVLGLDLQSKDEIDTFHTQASTWLRGVYNKPGSPEMETTLEVREYLVQMIENKIAQLKEAGQSDGSTVGGLVFATMGDVDRDGEDEDETAGIEANHNKQRTLSNNEVVDNALLLILASTEITSSTLANVLMLMGLHPDVWQCVVDEQKAVVKIHGEPLTDSILEHEFPYLEAVLKETLRILPVTLVSRRETNKSIIIDGYQIPKGWGVSYNIFLTHKLDDDDDESPNDSSNGMNLIEDFQPSRWLNPETRPKMVDYIPFGAGPRKCPGIVLANTEMKTFLSIFARSVLSYELAMDIDDSKPIDEQISWKQLNAVPIPEDGVKIRILSVS
mmetsp:Transcript_1846/g.3981  ORF Transcript_1846/g.3981 Transcript_1846/m.3981 type:complete len:581 (+) Transcript_1846:187-1929(+)|eukprot:CAMPEP_0172320348 /NCGR_PEP_ID=MMETSP1058-20130122/40334_1 /TAXON_ID=83371 /ORGANISM="Detonula confervacea, Strain CCMP 353" /LENGTH=580 /DNA_ID=CAMNT_0013035601 /DNA_START=126 /DNA_END=1868 /DNA_ORIENTATION=+